MPFYAYAGISGETVFIKMGFSENIILVYILTHSKMIQNS